MIDRPISRFPIANHPNREMIVVATSAFNDCLYCR